MQYSPVLTPFIVSTVILLSLAVHAILLPRQPIARLLSVTLFACSLWAAAYALETASAALPAKLLWMRVRFIPMSFVPFLWLALILGVTGRTRPVASGRFLFFLIEPAATISLVLSDGADRLFRYNYHLDPTGSSPALFYSSGPLFWVHVAYSYAVIAMGFTVLFSSQRGALPSYRRSLRLALAALLLAPAADALFQLGLTIPPGVNYSSAALAVSGVLAAVALLSSRIPEILPIASSLLFQTIEDSALILDGRGVVVDLNARARSLIGEEAGSAIGRPLSALPAPWAQVASCFAEGRGMEVSLDSPPAERIFSLSLAHLKDEAGRPQGGLLLMHDVTEQRKAERDLRANRERLQLAFDSATDGLWDWDLRTGTTYWSPRYLTMLGYAPDELSPDFETWRSLLHPADRSPAEAEVAGLVAGERDTNAIEFRIRAKDGSWRWVLSRGRIVERMPDGRAARIVGTHVDIGERKQMEEVLRESEEKFRSFIEQSAEAIMLVDEEGRLLEFNPVAEELTGIPRREAVGTAVWDLMLRTDLSEKRTPERRAELGAMFREALRTGDSRMFNRLIPATIVRADGTLRYLQQYVFPIRTSKGVRIGSISHDVTEMKMSEEALRRSEEQLLQAQKMEAVGRLAGGIAHDFNNLLTVIGGYCDILRNALPGESALQADVAEIAVAADKAASLTSRLLAFSRKQVLNPRVVDPNELVRDMLGMLGRVIGEDIELTTFLDPRAGCFRADPGQIEQVLMNLAVNARDAMPSGGRLTIGTSRRSVDEASAHENPEVPPGDYVRITVADTGCGMTEEVRTRIFEPFFTTKEQGKGTGLGLSMAYGILRQSGGFISCASKRGEGAVFEILLPRTADPPGDGAEGRSPPAATAGTETVLLVEDEEAVRDFTAMVLRMSGYTVIEAAGGAQALSSLAAGGSPITLLVTDVVMPHMNGNELARRVRQVRPEVKVLFVSGYAENAVLGEVPETCFIQKPFSPRDLLAAVRRVLDGQGR